MFRRDSSSQFLVYIPARGVLSLSGLGASKIEHARALLGQRRWCSVHSPRAIRLRLTTSRDELMVLSIKADTDQPSRIVVVMASCRGRRTGTLRGSAVRVWMATSEWGPDCLPVRPRPVRSSILNKGQSLLGHVINMQLSWNLPPEKKERKRGGKRKAEIPRKVTRYMRVLNPESGRSNTSEGKGDRDHHHRTTTQRGDSPFPYQHVCLNTARVFTFQRWLGAFSGSCTWTWAWKPMRLPGSFGRPMAPVSGRKTGRQEVGEMRKDPAE